MVLVNDGTVKIGVGFDVDTKQLQSIGKIAEKSLSTVKTSFKGIENIAKTSVSTYGKAFSGMQTVAESAFSAISSSAQTAMSISIGSISGAVTALSGLAGYAVSVGSDFEFAMDNVAATMGIVENQIVDGVNAYAMLEEAAQKAGESTVFTATESANALNYLALAGYDAEKAVGALPTVLNLAQAGNMDLAYASDMVTDAMAALQIAPTQENLTEFGDKLARTATRSNTSVSQLGQAILAVGGTAKDLAGGTTELNTVLGVMANRGIKGAEAGHKLRNMIISLSDPTKDAAAMMESLGLQVFDEYDNMRNLGDIFLDLKNITENMSDRDRTSVIGTLFNRYDQAAAESLISGAGDEFNELFTEVEENSDEAMAQMAKTMTDNLQGDIKLLKSQAESFGNTVYKSLNKSLRNTVQTTKGYIEQMQNAFKRGGFDSLAESFGDTLGHVIAVGADKIPHVTEMATDILEAIAEGIQNNSESLGKSFSVAVNDIPKFISSYLHILFNTGSDIINNTVKGIKGSEKKIGKTISDIILALPEFLLDTVTTLLPVGENIITYIIDGIAEKSPELDRKLIDIIMALPDFIMQNLDTVMTIGYMFVDSIAEGVKGNENKIGNDIADFILALPEFLVNSIETLLPVGEKIITSIIDGIASNDRGIMDKLVEIILALPEFVADNIGDILSIGSDIITKITDGISRNSDKLGKSSAKIISEIVKFIKQNFPKIVKSGKDLVKSFSDAISKEFPQLKPFGDIIEFISENIEVLADKFLTLFTVFAGYKVIGLVSSAIDGLKLILMGLDAALLSNPLLVIAGAIGAIITVASTLYDINNKMPDSLNKTAEKYADYSEELEESSQKLGELGETAKETADKEQAHLDKVEDLWKELDKLADSSGRVKAKDQDRAKYILGELNEAMGTEYEMVDGQIQKYDELAGSIEEVMKKKRAESLLSAYSEQYEEAKLQQDKTKQQELEAYIARQDVSNAKEKLKQQIESYLRERGSFYTAEELLENSEKWKDLSSQNKNKEVTEEIRNIKVEYDGIEYNIDNWKSLETVYADASTAYQEARWNLENINQIISNYEQAEAEALAGNYDKVAEYLNYKKDADTDWAELSKQNEEEITRHLNEQLRERQTAVDLANEHYADNANAENKRMTENATANLKEYLLEIENMGFGDLLNEQQKQILQTYHLELEVENADGAIEKLYKAGGTLEGQINSAWDAKLAPAIADHQVTSMSEALKKKIPELEEKLAESIKSGNQLAIDDCQAELWDMYNQASALGITGLTDGMIQHEKDIDDSAKIISMQTGKAIGDVKEYLWWSGYEVGSQVINGITSALRNPDSGIAGAIQFVSGQLPLRFKDDLDISSPSKVMRDEVGKWILPGIAVGVEDTVGDTADSINRSIDEITDNINPLEIGFTQDELSGIADRYYDAENYLQREIGNAHSITNNYYSSESRGSNISIVNYNTINVQGNAGDIDIDDIAERISSKQRENMKGIGY